MDFALLVGFGAAAVNPYVALDLVAAQWAAGEVGSETAEERAGRYVQAVGKGLLKVLSKMGVSTVMSYRGAQLFECVGLSADVVARYFTGTPSRVGGIGLEGIAADVRAPPRARARRRRARPGRRLRLPPARRAPRLEPRGHHRRCSAPCATSAPRATRVRGRRRRGEPARRRAARPDGARARRRADAARRGRALERDRAPLRVGRDVARLDLEGGARDARDRAQPPRRPLQQRRGRRGRAALGRSTPTATRGARRSSRWPPRASASRPPTWSTPTCCRSRSRRAPSPARAASCPATRSTSRSRACATRRPASGLISPPPHHDIYSIEDLAQLIHDLRCVNPTAEISVKLVALAGVGTVAAGVAKAGADHIVIAGMDGGTGASPTRRSGTPACPGSSAWPRRSRCWSATTCAGACGCRSTAACARGATSSIGALLGAEEFGFSTAPLVAAGCIMMRVCHLNTCPVGIATQDPELRRRFAGTPEHVVQYLLFVAEEVRELMAQLGVRRFEDLVGRTDLARQVSDGGAGIELGALLAHGRRTRGLARALRRHPGRRARGAARPRACWRWRATRWRAASR